MRKDFLLFFFLIAVCCSKDKECSDFKTGTFEYSDQLYNGLTVVRTDSTQIEISKKNGLEIHSSIKWIDDCNYVLTITKVLNDNLDSIIGKKITVEIIETKLKRFKLKSKSDVGIMELELIKIK